MGEYANWLERLAEYRVITVRRLVCVKVESRRFMNAACSGRGCGWSNYPIS